MISQNTAKTILPLMSYVKERPLWPIKSTNKGKKKKVKSKRRERDQIKFIDLRFER